MVTAIIRHCDKTSQTPDPQLYLEYCQQSGLWLRQKGPPAMSMQVDFVSGRQGYRVARAGQQRERLARACGLQTGKPRHIVDATAGLGRDAFMLASLGACVTLIERSEVVRELLIDGLQRAMAAGHAETVARMALIGDDSREWLIAKGPEAGADVVYLDPMYAGRRRAAAGKELAMLQSLLGEQNDADALLTAALEVARERVVVKRHQQAEPLGGIRPSYQLSGRSTRFDIYRVA